MTYLYAGLGLAMLTAIMAMFEMASGLTNQQMMTSPADDGYSLSVWKNDDQRFLKLLDSADATWGSGSPLCAKILDQIKPGQPYGDLSGYTPGQTGDSAHPSLAGACVFQKNEHRIVINRSDSVSSASTGSTLYRFYACNPQPQFGVVCSFELRRS